MHVYASFLGICTQVPVQEPLAIRMISRTDQSALLRVDARQDLEESLVLRTVEDYLEDGLYLNFLVI